MTLRFLALLAATLLAPAARAELTVTAVGKAFKPDPARTVAKQLESNTGGSTSIRNEAEESLEWKTHGYYQRNRDLGQVFTAPKDFTLAAIVLRTGPSDAAVLHGTPGAPVFVQFFEVEGEPKIHDNGTPKGTKAKHGFSPNHRCDDYLTGVTYKPLKVVKGGTFPALPPTRGATGQPTGDGTAKLHYMRWAFTGDDRLTFRAGKRYCFVVGIEEPGPERGFTLGNANMASVPDAPSLTDRHDLYHGGWGVRREGDGTVPPAMLPAGAAPADATAKRRMIHQSLFPTGAGRYAVPPTTDGYPDVDTYRDLDFALEEAKPE